jgi:hypothetical protein
MLLFQNIQQLFALIKNTGVIYCPSKSGYITQQQIKRVSNPAISKGFDYIPIEVETVGNVIFYIHPDTEDVPISSKVHVDFRPLLIIKKNGDSYWLKSW